MLKLPFCGVFHFWPDPDMSVLVILHRNYLHSADSPHILSENRASPIWMDYLDCQWLSSFSLPKWLFRGYSIPVYPISKQPYCPDHAMGPMDVAMMRRCFFDVAYRLAPTGAGVLRGLIVTGAGSRGHVGLGLRRVTGDWDGGSSLNFGQVRNFRLSSAEFEEWNKEKTKLIGFSSKWRIFSPIERAFCQ